MSSIKPSPYQSDKDLLYNGHHVGLAKSEFEGKTGMGTSFRLANPTWWFILIDKKVLLYKPPSGRPYAPRAREIYERDSKLYYVGKTGDKLIDLNDPTIELRDGKMEVSGHIYYY